MTSVLVVDDDEPLCTAVSRELAHRGFETSSAFCVDDALRSLSSSSPPDVLVADLRMPGRDGVDLLQATTLVSPRTRAILMSAFSTARDYQAALSCGAVRVLCKPFTSDELFSAIGHAIECENGFRGDLHGLSLTDLMQMYHFARRSVTIEVAGALHGAVHLRHGEIIHADAGALRGEDALRAILARPSGSFSTRVLHDVNATIDRNFDGLLLDCLREIDEETRDVEVALDEQMVIARESYPPAAAALATSWVAGMRDALQRLAPEVHMATIALASGVIDATGVGFDAAWLSFARDIAAALDRLTPNWGRYERISSGHALALIRGPDDLVIALSWAMGTRYGALKFRAVVGRLNSMDAMGKQTVNGGIDGKD